MSVLNTNDGLLTNAEVWHLLSVSNPQRKGKEHIECMVVENLTKQSKVVDLPTVTRLIKDIHALGLRLTEAEVLMIVNHTPISAVEIHLVSCIRLVTIQPLMTGSSDCGGLPRETVRRAGGGAHRSCFETSASWS